MPVSKGAFVLLFSLFVFSVQSFADPEKAIQASTREQRLDLLRKIPDGYREGRPDANPGAYNSVVHPEAQPFKDRMEFLEKKVFGLVGLADKDPMLSTPMIYILENEILRLQLDIANSKIFTDNFEKKLLERAAFHLYESLCFHRDRTFEDMVRFIDVKIPGPNGGQFRFHQGDLELYYPNFRMDTLLSEEDQKVEYKKKLDEFLKNGGSLSEMEILSSEKIQANGGGVQWMEYAQRPNKEIWVTKGKAGHILLAEGGPVISSGQIMLVQDDSGRVLMAAVTNASGSYKPDMYSAELFSHDLADILDIPGDTIILTRGEPLSSQTFRIYMKGKGYSKEKIARRSKQLETWGKQILSEPIPTTCDDLYHGACKKVVSNNKINVSACGTKFSKISGP